MFMGHYAAAFAAKAAEPRAPLWIYVAAAEALDISWSVLVVAGVERVRFDASLPGAPLVLEYMPWSHSLPAALIWAAVLALLAGLALKLPRRAMLFVGLAVFAHWLLDLMVHRPDLALWPEGPRVGLALWQAPVLAQVVEMGLLALAAGAWLAQRGKTGARLWPGLALLGLLVTLQIVSTAAPPVGDAMIVARFGLSIYLAMIFVAAFTERRAGAIGRV